ncbi:MAG: methyltransferase domain-containing protein, partial [Bacteroidetes bacterium]
MRRLEVDYSLDSMAVMVNMARYNFVNRVINNPNLSVLDFGCGSGYGTRILKEKFKNVTSFDIYPDNYQPDNIDVIQ